MKGQQPGAATWPPLRLPLPRGPPEKDPLCRESDGRALLESLLLGAQLLQYEWPDSHQR